MGQTPATWINLTLLLGQTQQSHLMSATEQIETAIDPPPPPLASAPKKKKKKRKKSTPEAQAANANCNSSQLSLKKRIFLKKSAKQTPWYDANELMSTGRDLLLALKLFPSQHNSGNPLHTPYNDLSALAPVGLSNDEHSRLHSALRRVALWRGRSDRGKLPHAIDVTAGLAGVLLLDAERGRDASIVNCDARITTHAQSMRRNIVSLYQLRNSYSTLLLRSVNGLADTYRHQKKSALLSVSHCCSLAGLPLWIVDVRHDASHNDLPSLGVCRIGALESLKFWKGRYWDELDEKVFGDIPSSQKSNETASGDGTNDLPKAGARTLALDCLMRYQKAVEIESIQRQEAFEKKKVKPDIREYQRFSHWQEFSSQNGDDEKHSDDAILAANAENDIMMLPSNEDNRKANEDEGKAKKQKKEDDKANPWWILDDRKPKKKKEKTSAQAREDVVVSNDPDCSTMDGNENKSSTDSTESSSRDCAAELIRSTPVDVLYSTVLQFLVWGGAVKSFGKCDEIPCIRGPAFLSISTHKTTSLGELDLECAFEESRLLYEPLIVSIGSSYIGFLAALFVHLVDSMLCMDTEVKRSLDKSSDISEDSAKEIKWNLRLLAMWTCYILTREFHMHLDRSVAVINVIGNGIGKQSTLETIDLKKKGRRKWTPNEQQCMQSPLPYRMLRMCGIPLNSVCDKILSHLGNSPVQSEDCEDTVFEVLKFFENILGKERILLFGISEPAVIENAPVANLVDSKHTNLAPWTLCKSWDACAIGTMPGSPA